MIYVEQQVTVVKTNIKSKKNLFNAVTIGCAISSEKGVINIEKIEELIHKSSVENWGNVSGPYLIREGVYQCHVSYSMGSIDKYVIQKGTPKECLFDAHLFLSYFYNQKITVVMGRDRLVNIQDALAFVSKAKQGIRETNDKPLVAPMIMGPSSYVENQWMNDDLPPPQKKQKKSTVLC